MPRFVLVLAVATDLGVLLVAATATNTRNLTPTFDQAFTEVLTISKGSFMMVVIVKQVLYTVNIKKQS